MIIADGGVPGSGYVFLVQIDAAGKRYVPVHNHDFAVIPQVELELAFKRVGLGPSHDFKVGDAAVSGKQAAENGLGAAELIE